MVWGKEEEWKARMKNGEERDLPEQEKGLGVHSADGWEAKMGL